MKRNSNEKYLLMSKFLNLYGLLKAIYLLMVSLDLLFPICQGLKLLEQFGFYEGDCNKLTLEEKMMKSKKR